MSKTFKTFKSKSKSKSKIVNNKYKTDLCEDKMTFNECELAILRHAVDETENIKKKKIANSADVYKMISILEDFLIRKKLICYGGTAINNILPKSAQFYNKETEISDYDFYSSNALEDAKELADIYYKAGYKEVEAKSGLHYGTFKVFVNFIPMADITYLHTDLFNSILTEAITVAGIKYAPANFLRMNMYLELSRPAGDVSRWEKVLKRLTLLNEHFPLNIPVDCNMVDFQRKMETNMKSSEQIYFTVRDTFINLGVIFFGGYASSIYSDYMPKTQQKIVEKIPDFDVISEDPDRTSLIIKERLEEIGIKNVKLIHHEEIGEIIPEHIEIRTGKDTIAFIYKPIACHNYNTITIDGKEINIATIDTILAFYLAFYYANKPYYYRDRILCITHFLFNLEEQNRLEQKGVLKRFSISCVGKQPSLEDIRATKSDKFIELSGMKESLEYQMWFLKYNPRENSKKNLKTGYDKKENIDKTRKHRSNNKNNFTRYNKANFWY